MRQDPQAVGVFLPSRVWNKMPVELSWKWQQLRKDGIELRWTCIRPANVVKDLRDITFETHWCSSARRFGFFIVAHYAYTAVGERKYYESRSIMRFRPGLASKLYDTMGKVIAPAFEVGIAQSYASPGNSRTPYYWEAWSPQWSAISNNHGLVW